MARRKNSESIGNDSEFGDNYVEEPDFSDPEDFVDDIAEEGMSVWAGLTPTNMYFVILEIIVLFCP